MATPQNNGGSKNKDKSADKSAPTPPPAPAAIETGAAPAAAPADGGEKKVDTALGTPVDARDRKVLVWSQVDPDFRVRVLASQLKQYGAPEHKGKPMLAKAGALGDTAEKAAQKAAEKAAFEALSPDEKIAHAKKVREARDAAKAAKKAAEREQLIAQLKAEIAAGKA